MDARIEDPARRKELLKHMILQLHSGEAPEVMRRQLVRVLGQVPYDEVVEVEQQLIEEGLPVQDVLSLCDVHTAALQGAIDPGEDREVPAGHPVDTFRRENEALREIVARLRQLNEAAGARSDEAGAADLAGEMLSGLRDLADVEKHYLRKENLLFPLLERHGISGPPAVMWGKHDQARQLLAGALEAAGAMGDATAGELAAVAKLAIDPICDAVAGMIDKEEQILLPMALDTLTDTEWAEVERGSPEIGYCLVAPAGAWIPDVAQSATGPDAGGRVRLPSGTVSLPELRAILDLLPVDLSFVGADDTVRWFNEPRERVFPRTRAVIGRKVQLCHPPSSVHVVNRILSAFRAGEQDRAAFWLELRGRFVHIEYLAVRDEAGAYLGCLEVTQDLTAKRGLTGQRRLLEWGTPEASPEVGHGTAA